MTRSRLARTLPEGVRQFLGFTSPRILLTCLVLAVVARLWVGDYAWSNLIWFAVVIVIQPFLEWFLHVFVLHAKPVELAGREFDTVVARDHRAHHADPRDLPLIFIPLRWCIYLVLSVLLIGLLIPTWSGRTSFWVAAFAMAVAYEWSHFLIHTDYKPKTRAYRHLYTNHRLHHFRNEKYWFGITNTLGDRILRTAPDKNDVPVSPTARNLHGGVTTRT
ncbi:MAG: sterol desaturase family protein [Candidatus Nanopelagicales bacterium]